MPRRRRITQAVARSAPEARSGHRPASPPGSPAEAARDQFSQASPHGRTVVARVLTRPVPTRVPPGPIMPAHTHGMRRVTRCQVLPLPRCPAIAGVESAGGIVSVPLSVGSLRLGVTQRPALWSSDFPRADAEASARDHPTHSPHHHYTPMRGATAIVAAMVRTWTPGSRLCITRKSGRLRRGHAVHRRCVALSYGGVTPARLCCAGVRCRTRAPGLLLRVRCANSSPARARPQRQRHTTQRPGRHGS